jgi:Major Facilitator Superfamily
LLSTSRGDSGPAPRDGCRFPAPVRRGALRLRFGSLKPRLALTHGDGLTEETCRRLTLAATVLGSSMAYVTAINVAVPAIGADLEIDLGGQQWVILSYSLALASLYLVAGALGDRLGRRRMFMVGATAFAVASALGGLAPSAAVLIVARVLQGAAGALLTTGSLPLALHLRRGERPRDRHLDGRHRGGQSRRPLRSGARSSSGPRGAGSSTSTSPSLSAPSTSPGWGEERARAGRRPPRGSTSSELRSSRSGSAS